MKWNWKYQLKYENTKIWKYKNMKYENGIGIDENVMRIIGYRIS